MSSLLQQKKIILHNVTKKFFIKEHELKKWILYILLTNIFIFRLKMLAFNTVLSKFSTIFLEFFNKLILKLYGIIFDNFEKCGNL